MTAFYGVTSSPEGISPFDYIAWYVDEQAAHREAISQATADQGTYYVHHIDSKPVFRASVVNTVNTEVLP